VARPPVEAGTPIRAPGMTETPAEHRLEVGAPLRPVVETLRTGKQQAGNSRAAEGRRRTIRHITVRRAAGKREAAVKTVALLRAQWAE
jgi:hypothetical protein